MPRKKKREYPNINDRVRVDHMLAAAQDAQQFLIGRTRADLDNDTLFRRALSHAILEIGEAANSLSPDAKARLPGIPWAQVNTTRQILVHVYWGVDRNRLWLTARDDIPILIRTIEIAIALWPEDELEE